ncbi:MAG: iron chaperone [Bacteroidia bacterium]
MKKPVSVEDYIKSYPKEVQKIIKDVQATIKKSAPKATESISYGMPYYSLGGRLVYFAAHKNHVGFYPLTTGIAAFKKELSIYKGAKGSVQFPYDKKMPLTLIAKIVKFRVKENEAKIKLKKAKRG